MSGPPAEMALARGELRRFIKPTTKFGVRAFDLTGMRIFAWTVIELLGRDTENLVAVYWLCRCECGTTRPVLGGSLRDGGSVSCGCRKRAGVGATDEEKRSHAELQARIKEWFSAIRHGDKDVSQRKRWDSTFQRKYGVTLEYVERMLADQGGECAICGKAIALGMRCKGTGNGRGQKSGPGIAIDHCHRTGKVRGVLCNECNIGIGMFKERTDAMSKAIEYLQNHNGDVQ